MDFVIPITTLGIIERLGMAKEISKLVQSIPNSTTSFKSPIEYFYYTQTRFAVISQCLRDNDIMCILKERAQEQINHIGQSLYSLNLYNKMVLVPVSYMSEDKVINEITLDRIFSIFPDGLDARKQIEALWMLLGNYCRKPEVRTTDFNYLHNNSRTRAFGMLKRAIGNNPEYFADKDQTFSAYFKLTKYKNQKDFLDTELIHLATWGYWDENYKTTNKILIFTADRKEEFIHRFIEYWYFSMKMKTHLQDFYNVEPVSTVDSEILGKVIFLDSQNLLNETEAVDLIEIIQVSDTLKTPLE
ncbi:MAG TPA: hypothetical protein PKA63_12270 [Oligoflexia bacterium]|nr:hypothetical protein [Oligoflexia bacterium]HMP49431.1 hypothetical protein [Oligoflexia bacterium]